ncbi:MAG TPA: hypothetical protein VL527_10880 [Dongiaceae bacterium]|nr:hypothetical protein [Dongiaceae bacterium]
MRSPRATGTFEHSPQFQLRVASPPIKSQPCKGDPAADSPLANSPWVEQIACKQISTNQMVTTRQSDYLNRLTSIANTGSLRMTLRQSA